MIRVGFLLALLLPLVLWLASVGDPRLYLEDSVPVPAGQLPYILSKLGGLLAVGLFALQLALIVFRNTRFGPTTREWSTRAHWWLGTVVCLLIFTHVALFVTAASLRSGHFAVQLLLPRFDAGFYDAMVSLGVLALYLVVALAILGFLSRRHSARGKGKFLHRTIALTTVPLIVSHSFAIGSETNTLSILLFYGLLCLVMLAGIWHSLRRTPRPAIERRQSASGHGARYP